MGVETLVNKEGIVSEINELRTKIHLASENGLFENTESDPDSCTRLFSLLKESYDKVDSDIAEAQLKLDTARCNFDRYREKASSGWRLENVYGLHIFLYFFIVLVSLFFLWSLVIEKSEKMIYFLWVPIWSFTWGTTGSVLRGIYWLWYQVNRGSFRKIWTIWFLSAPIMGGILGGIMYLIFHSGYITTTSTTISTNDGLSMLLCALAGFNWPWAINVMKKLTEIFSSDTK